MKVKWMLDALGRDYQWVEVDIMSGGSRTAEFLLLNPFGQVPTLVLEDGRVVTQSNAILLHLAEHSGWIPTDPFERAKMFEWLFWEQYSHEPYVAVARFQRVYAGRAADAVEPRLMERGYVALGHMEQALTTSAWLAGGQAPTLADLALVAYTRVAHEGGFDLAACPNVRDWIGRTEAALGII
ncbi:glutathione S-transferase family protein [Brevundimonas subvibrioides]|uniref:glutathione S-transferase family protein n=1 Tax=Brevundimonas subvibrioides TaxID=74313 RepID=UPI0032D5A3AA